MILSTSSMIKPKVLFTFATEIGGSTVFIPCCQSTFTSKQKHMKIKELSEAIHTLKKQ